MSYLDRDYRQIFKNILMPEAVGNLDIGRWVNHCADAGATSVCIDIKTQAYALYDSEFIEKDPALGSRDLAAEVSDATRKLGLKWCAYIAPQELESLLDTRLEWEQKTEDGSSPMRQGGGWMKTCFCWNSPYRDLLVSVLREIAEKYKPHGFFIDGLNYGETTCYCEYCRARFLKEYGLPLPTKKALLDNPDAKGWPLFIKARKLWVGDAARIMKNAVHSVDGNISIFVNNGFGGQHLGSASPALAEHFILSHEFIPCVVRSDGRPYGFSAGDTFLWTYGMQRAAQKGNTCQVYTYFTPVTRRDDMNMFADFACSAGARMAVQETRSDMKPLMARIEEMEPWLSDVRPLPDISIHYSEAAQLAYYKPYKNKVSLEDLFTHNVDSFHKEARGIFKAIVNMHRPVEMLVDGDLDAGDYRRSKLLVLPNSAVLSKEASTKLRTHLEQGGAVIASMLTGTMDEFGETVTNELLMPGSGLKTLGTVKTRKPFYMKQHNGKLVFEEPCSANPPQYLLFKEGTLKDWLGEDMAVHVRQHKLLDKRYSPDDDIPVCGQPKSGDSAHLCQLCGDPIVYLPPDANGPPANESVLKLSADESWTVLAAVKYRDEDSGDWQESPAILSRPVGKGCLIYVAFQLGSFLLTHRTMTWDNGYFWGRKLLSHLIDKAIGPARIRIEAPACVKTTFWKQGDKTLIHLVNELSSLVDELQMEERLPVAIKVFIPNTYCSSVKIAVGKKGCRTTRTDGGWTVSCPSFKERMLIVCG